MNGKRFLAFSGIFILAHTVTYFLAGLIFYPLLTKPFYVGPNPIFAVFMRTPADPAVWAHAVRWFLPAQFLRGFLMAAAIYPFFDTLAAWSFRKRWLCIASLYVVLGFWAAAVAAPGTIEGMVYLRPVFTTAAVHVKVQPEVLFQGLAMGAWIAGWIGLPPAAAKARDLR